MLNPPLTLIENISDFNYLNFNIVIWHKNNFENVITDLETLQNIQPFLILVEFKTIDSLQISCSLKHYYIIMYINQPVIYCSDSVIELSNVNSTNYANQLIVDIKTV